MGKSPINGPFSIDTFDYEGSLTCGSPLLDIPFESSFEALQ